MEDSCSLNSSPCQPTDSQDEKLHSPHIARESEVVSGDTQSSSSADEASEQATGIVMVTLPESSDEYQTPPEHHLNSQNSSNDGQAPAAETEPLDQETEVADVVDGDTMVVDDSYEPKGKGVVDLTKDTDNLEFPEKSAVLEDNNECARKLFDEMPVREEEASTATEVNTSDVGPKGKRRLPVSLNGAENKHGGFLDIMDRALKLLKVEGKAKVGGDDDADFLETAMRRGMTFPRPRWWPPEGGSED